MTESIARMSMLLCPSAVPGPGPGVDLVAEMLGIGGLLHACCQQIDDLALALVVEAQGDQIGLACAGDRGGDGCSASIIG